MKEMLLKRSLDIWQYGKYVFFGIVLLLCFVVLAVLIIKFPLTDKGILLLLATGCWTCIVVVFYLILMAVQQNDFISIDGQGISYRLCKWYSLVPSEGNIAWSQISSADLFVQKLVHGNPENRYRWSYSLELRTKDGAEKSLPADDFGLYGYEEDKYPWLYENGINRIPVVVLGNDDYASDYAYYVKRLFFFLAFLIPCLFFLARARIEIF